MHETAGLEAVSFPPTVAPSVRTWTITQGHAGMRAQAEGLAEAAGWSFEPVTIQPRLPWKWLPRRWWISPLGAVDPELFLADHWPDVAISCGKFSAPVSAALRRYGARAVHVQNPCYPPDAFDVIVAPRHDRMSCPNVVETRTAIHRATPGRLVEARARWKPRLAHLPRPFVVVLLGGSNGRFRLDTAAGSRLAGELVRMMQGDRVGLYVTPSRRTDPAVTAMLARALRPLGAEVWDGQGDNPYFGLLACADAIVVTMDSVSMVSEACATSAPVLIAELPGRSKRIGRFLEGLTRDGRIRRFRGRLETWETLPIDDTAAAAEAVRDRLGI